MKVAIIPPIEGWLQKERYLKIENNYDLKLRKYFEKMGHEYKIINEYDHNEWETIDAFIFMNFYDWHSPIYKQLIKLNLEQRCIYGMYEPNAVMNFHNSASCDIILKYFNIIYTWNLNLVDNKRIFEFQILCEDDININYSNIPFEQRKLLVNISGNKEAHVPEELYSERKRVIEYFEIHSQDDFDLYGTGWSKEGYKNYLGVCESKTKTYHNYKFALCLENCTEINYVTEKIFDCFRAGIVPVYAGSTNISDKIPYKCFINYNMFDNIEDMVKFIKNIELKEYQNYLNEAKRFINSKEMVYFKSETCYEQLLKVISRSRENFFKVKFKDKVKYINRKNIIKVKRFIKAKFNNIIKTSK